MSSPRPLPASQPWPFPASLMLGFTARARRRIAVRPDQVEMAEAGWFTREQVAQAADWTDIRGADGGAFARDPAASCRSRVS